MNTVEITQDNFKQLVDKEGIVVLDWWASWCAPCRAFAPVFEGAAKRHSDVTWGKVNTQEQPGLAQAFSVQSIPTLMVFRDGVLVFEQPGFVPGPFLDELVKQVKAVDMAQIRRELADEKAHLAAR